MNRVNILVCGKVQWQTKLSQGSFLTLTAKGNLPPPENTSLTLYKDLKDREAGVLLSAKEEIRTGVASHGFHPPEVGGP